MVLAKLKISGIRSYSPTEASLIAFDSPLTMILGPNGTGKTTIIEALKYITTGELPINTRGGAFINDPKIVQKLINTAMVSLEFHSVNGEQVKIKRTLQATVKNSTLTQKTTETSLSVFRDDKWEMSVTKNADVDKELAAHFGISSSLFENVIFCHQEEANWILSEPINVKRKLDEIFATTKYSKALDGLKKLKKDTTQALKIRNVELVAATEKKLKKERLANDIEDTRVKIRDIENKLASNPERQLDIEIESLNRDISVEKNKEKEFFLIQCEINTLSKRLEGVTSLEDVRDIVVVLDEYINEDTKQAENRGLSFLYSENSYKGVVVNSLEELNNYITGKNYSLVAKSINMKIQVLNQTVQETAGTLKLLTDVSLQIPHVYSNVKNIIQEIIHLETEILNIKEEVIGFIGEEVENYDKFLLDLKKEGDFYDVKSEIMALQNTIRESEEVRFDNKMRLTEVKNSIERNTKKCFEINQDILVFIAELDEMTAFEDRPSCIEDEGVILDNKKKLIESIRDLEEKYEKNVVQNENIIRNRNKIELKGQYEEQIIENYNNFRDFIEKVKLLLFNSETSNPEIFNGITFDKFMDLDEKYFISMKDELNSLLKHDLSIKRLIDDFNGSLNELLKYRQVAFLSDFFLKNDQKVFTGLRDKIDENARISNLTESAKLLFQNFERKGTKRSICYLCKRKLDTDELSVYQDHICNTIKELEEKIMNLKILKDEYEGSYRIQNEDKERRMTIENLLLTLKDILIEISHGVNNAELSSTLSLTEWGSNLRDLELNEVIGDVTNRLRVDTLEELIENLAVIVSGLKSDIITRYKEIRVDFDIKDLFDVESLKEEIKSKRNTIGEYDRILFTIQKERAFYEKLKTRKLVETKLETRRFDLNDTQQMMDEDREQELQLSIEIKNIENMISRTSNELKTRQMEFNEMTEAHRNKIYKLTGDIKTLKNNDLSLRVKRSEFLESFKKYASIVSTCLSIVNNTDFGNLPKDGRALKEFVESQHNTVTRTCFNLIEQLNIEQGRQKAEFVLYEDLIKKTDFLMSYMDSAQERQRLCLLRSNFTDFDPKRLLNLEGSLSTLKEQRDEIMKHRYLLEGELKQLALNLKAHTYSLANEFSLIDEQYNKLYVEIKTTELIISDLERSTKALDGSIVQYYKSKIEEINAILKDLWTNTYRGSDIEYIELKNEVSDTKAYNYKMVMVKSGVELDMRGRCSAGQKVLAGILVRLALCEAFCQSCFIIGLDEPTTNLDRENVEALAHTIKKLVEERNTSSNFQLVIITHDEAFAEMISQNGCDSFYKVSKDRNGNSKIRLCTRNAFK